MSELKNDPESDLFDLLKKEIARETLNEQFIDVYGPEAILDALRFHYMIQALAESHEVIGDAYRRLQLAIKLVA